VVSPFKSIREEDAEEPRLLSKMKNEPDLSGKTGEK